MTTMTRKKKEEKGTNHQGRENDTDGTRTNRHYRSCEEEKWMDRF